MNNASSPLPSTFAETRSWRPTACASLILAALFIAILFAMGRIWWCECGFGLWTSDANGEATSQHLADPYTFTHVLHGIIFYWALGLWSKTAPLHRRFLLSLVIEVVWEILENSPPVIERYREATAALGYYGDSILNAMGDLIACACGFYLAARLPARIVVVVAVIEEIVLLLAIRDNLTLNIIMLLFPIESIKQWQLGA
jgi:hypothetical protein